MKHNENVTTIFALGGLGEVGKTCMSSNMIMK